MFLRQKGFPFIVTNICSVTMRWTELWVFLCLFKCVLNVWHCQPEKATFAVRDWQRARHQQQPAVYGQRCTSLQQAGWPSTYIYSLCSSHLPKPLVSTFFFPSICLPLSHYSMSISSPLSPTSLPLSPLSSNVPHRLSFLSKPFSHPLLRLVFFLWVSEWREGNRSFEYLMPHMKNVALVISQRYKLVNFLQDTTLQVTRWCKKMTGGRGLKPCNLL